MSVANQVKETALDAFIAVWDHGHLVPRVIAEIKLPTRYLCQL